MKKAYISPMIGAETMTCGVILDGSPVGPNLGVGGNGNGMTSDAPARKGNPLNGQINLN